MERHNAQQAAGEDMQRGSRTPGTVILYSTADRHFVDLSILTSGELESMALH